MRGRRTEIVAGLIALALLAMTTAHAGPALVEVPIRSISMSMSEEEGGYAHFLYHPSGWLEFTGRPSCCGYKPPLATGWYKLEPVAAQRLFDAAARALASGKATAAVPGAATGNGTEITLADGHVFVIGGLGELDPAHGRRVSSRPRDWDRRVYVGHHVASVAVLRTLDGDAASAAALSSDEVAQLLETLIRERSEGVAATEKIRRILRALPASSADQLAGWIAGPRPISIQVADVLDALGARGPAARAHVAAIAAAATDDMTLAAAANALAAIGGPDAARLLEPLVMRLGEAPHERNLQIFYRLKFAAALRRIDTSRARETLQRQVFPVVLAHLENDGANALDDVARAVEAWRGLPEERRLDEAGNALYARQLRSERSDDRRAAIERIHARYGNALPTALRTEIERLRGDADPNVRNWAERASKP